jgi:hypothetical protein
LPAPKQTLRLPSLRLPKLPKLSLRSLPGARAVNSKLFVAAPLAFTLIVGTGVIARGHRNADGAPKTVYLVATPGEAPKVEPAKNEAGEPAPQAEEPKAPPRAEDPKSSRRVKDAVAAPKAGAAIQTARANQAEAAPKALESEPVATAPVSSPREATLNIVALPWAEVFVDGTRQGVSPPLRSIPLRPGRHRVELRNSSFPAHVQTVELKPGAEISITHRFRR